MRHPPQQVEYQVLAKDEAEFFHDTTNNVSISPLNIRNYALALPFVRSLGHQVGNCSFDPGKIPV